MAKFDTYDENTVPADADLVITTDVSDTSADATGTTKKLSLTGLADYVNDSGNLDATYVKLNGSNQPFTGNVTVRNGFAFLQIENNSTDAPANARILRVLATSAGSASIYPVNDSGGQVGSKGAIVVGLADGSVDIGNKLTVPDATADGQALAHSQAGGQLETLLIQKGSYPRIDIRDTNQPTLNQTFRIQCDQGDFFIQAATDGGTTQFNNLRLTRAGGVRMDEATSVLVPVPTVAGSAAQVTAAPSSTTGQYTLANGVEVGDTGWRAVVSWTGGVQDGSNQIGTINAAGYALTGDAQILMRRIGSEVFLQMPTTGISTIVATAVSLFSSGGMPTGFTAEFFGGLDVAAAANSPTLKADFAASKTNPRFRTPDGAGALTYATARWVPAATWPTTLPGTEVTPPANN